MCSTAGAQQNGTQCAGLMPLFQDPHETLEETHCVWFHPVSRGRLSPSLVHAIRLCGSLPHRRWTSAMLFFPPDSTVSDWTVPDRGAGCTDRRAHPAAGRGVSCSTVPDRRIQESHRMGRGLCRVCSLCFCSGWVEGW